uniref:J domain-containing protein n=1 Tax=Romanomermis culicivorax TaxID=13658 RepID=A0A915HGC8_ROMCU
MSFAKECKALFNSKCFYEILGLSKDDDVKPAEIKKAYYKASLLYHPDRCEKNQEESATKKFQALSKIYSVLSDKEKRAIYDETGEIDDEALNNNENDKDWIAYWRLLFKKVTVEDIKKFEEKYKNSEEERDDLKHAYLKFKGDFTKILENIFCSTLDDEDRLKSIITEMIEKENLPKYKAFTNESKNKQAARKRKVKFLNVNDSITLPAF